MAKETEKPQAQEIERRVLTVEDVELRVDDGDQRRLTGYAAKFGKWSEDLGGFREKIAKGAFADVLRDDVRCLKNHDPNLILGRTTSGTLKIEENSVGLRFTADLPDTTTGRDTAEEVRRGDISGCSFSFRVLEDDWKYLEDGSIERTILRFKALYDVGPVTYPAYPDTSVAARSLEVFRKTHKTPAAVPPQPELTPERRREIERQYRKAGRIINRNRPAEAGADIPGRSPGKT